MSKSQHNLETLQDIRKMMDRSSRFISLSGFSGVAAGSFALIGTWIARQRINHYEGASSENCPNCLQSELITIAVVVFVAAFTSAVLFTVLKTRKDGVAIWGTVAKRLLWNTIVPMLAGGFLIWRMIVLEQYDLIPAASLIFYGLALINGSKYTLGEVRYLGYAQLVIGIMGVWFPELGLYFWAFGFGILHIIYGVAMWWKYERRKL